nr:hypothetical protein JVH1_3963 [Rhodococcus sp. JVH1]
MHIGSPNSTRRVRSYGEPSGWSGRTHHPEHSDEDQPERWAGDMTGRERAGYE